MKVMEIAIDNILKPIKDATGMASGFYQHPDYIDHERDSVLGRGWAALSLKSDLPQLGWSMPIEFMGLPLLVTHDRTGQYRVFHNVCRHRGMILVEKAGAIQNVIRCPYHSWAYAMDGRLVATPHIGGQDKHTCDHLDKSKYGLMEVRSAFFMNVLMINLSGEAQDFDDHIDPLLSRWEKFIGCDGQQHMSLAPDHHKWQVEVNCNWKLAVENYAEAYHLPSLHPELNAVSPLNVHYNIVIGDDFSGQGTTAYSDPKESASLPFFPSWPQDKKNFGEYVCVYPNLLTGIQNNHAFVLLLFPVSPTKTLEKLEVFYIGDGVEKEFESARAAAMESWTKVFSEDVGAVEGMQKGRSSPYYDGGVYAVPLEEPTHHFHRWVATQAKKGLAAL